MNLWKNPKFKKMDITDFPHYEDYENFYDTIIDKHFSERPKSGSFISVGMYRNFRHQSYTRYNVRSIVEIETYGRSKNKKISMQFKYNFKTKRGQWRRIQKGIR